MEFIETTLGMEYQEIQRTDASRYYLYDAVIVTEAAEVAVLSVVSVDWIRDYRNAAADEIHLSLIVSWGTYLTHILPFKENLKVLLTRSGHSMTTLQSDIEQQTLAVTDTGSTSFLFNAFLETGDESEQIAMRPETASEQTADLTSLRAITLQLQEEAFTILRSQMVGGSFRDSVPMDILMSLLVKCSEALDLDLENSVAGYKVMSPNNTTPRSNVILPHGLPLVSLAQHLQQEHGGIYTSGIGCYYQKGHWWVWPLYDHTLLDEVRDSALFIVVPNDRLKGVERTWRMRDTQLVAIITGGMSRIDPSELLQLNEGTATRYVESSRVLEGFFETRDNKAIAKRGENTSEYEAIRRNSRGMGRVTADVTHSNAFHEASKLTARNGAYVTLNWENSDPDRITPGLQCEVAFFVKGVAEYVRGVVVHAHSYSALSGSGLHQKYHQITTQVVVMVDRHSPAYLRAFEA